MRRAMILAVVMMLVALGALTSVGVLFRSNAEIYTVSASGRAARSRALARSGIAGVMRELELQRMRIFAGEDPILTDELSVPQGDGRVGVVRIIRVGGSTARSESAKINVNHTDEQTLARLALVGPDLASRIVAARPLATIDDLLAVEGVTPEQLYGGMRALLATDTTTEDEVVGEAAPVSLRDVLTVHGFWPSIQLGAGDSGSRFAGERRINLNRPWSEDLGRAISRRYSQDVADGVRGILARGVTFKADHDIANVLMQLRVEPADWPEILDSFCVTDAPTQDGRVDISRAPAEVLAALPGMDDTSAGALKASRTTVDRADLTTVAWTITSGAIDTATLAKCIDTIAPSSAQWRVTLEAGFLPADAVEGDEPPPLEQRVVMEAVVDISTPRARLAELTDISNLMLAAAWRLEAPADDPGFAEGTTEEDEATPVDTLDGGDEPNADAPEPDVDPDTDNQDAAHAPAPPPADHRVGRFRVPVGGAPVSPGGGVSP